MTIVRAVLLLWLAVALAGCDNPNTAPALRLQQDVGGGPGRLSQGNGG